MKVKFISGLVFLGTAWLTLSSASYASSAQIIGIYENCRFANVTVVTSNGSVPGNAGLEAEIAAAKANSFDQAARMARDVLANYGLNKIEIERRGYAGCAPNLSGKYVEALGFYCEGKLVKAEILVDGQVVASQTGQEHSFEDFVAMQRRTLKQRGIPDEPKITVQNDQNCAQPQSS